MAELFIGLMTGTSVDSIDAALVDLTPNPPRLLAKRATPIPSSVRDALFALSRPGTDELDRMAGLDSALGRLMARAAQSLLDEANLGSKAIRAIGSHGQTVRHSPNGSEPYTIQIGNPNLITELTGICTVADFRRRDMAAGGQGAPLAPTFHDAFFRQSGETRVMVNIGGIANITILPADLEDPVRGFDTGPGNGLLDAWAQRHLNTPMDRDGTWGATGRSIPDLLNHCLNDSYFSLPPPKSTGREYFNLEWLGAKLADLGLDPAPRDIQATLVELSVQSIVKAVRKEAPDIKRLLICGGGVQNPLLMAGLRRELTPLVVESTAAYGVDPDYLEAIGFAWLAKRTLDGMPGNLPAVTGARGPRILGGIYPA